MPQVLVDLLNSYLDFKLVLLILVTSYWAKKNLADVFVKIKVAHKILVWATLVTIIYYITLKYTGVFKLENVANYIMSYCFATSIYELAISPIEDYFKKFTGNKQ